MISKEMFKKVVEEYREQDKIDNEIDKALQKVCGSWVCFQTENRIYEVIIDMMEEMFHDECGMIFYFIVEGKITLYDEKDKKTVIKTPEKLYDYLISCL